MKKRTLVVYDPKEAAAYAKAVRVPHPSIEVAVCGTEAELAGEIGKAEILFSRAFPREFLTKAKSLRWFHCISAGVENIVGPELDLDVLLTRTGGVYGKWMTEYVIGWSLWATQQMEAQREAQRTREWRRWLPAALHGKTMTIVGFGDVGATIARGAAAFGVRVIGVRRHRRQRSRAIVVYGAGDLKEAMAKGDFVVVTLPLTNQTRGLIGESELGSMKHAAWLLNISRGSVVDEEALVRVLRERKIAGAILDVFATEPLPKTSPLWTAENVVITPHIAALSLPEEVTPVFNENLRRYLSGRKLRFLVDRTRGY